MLSFFLQAENIFMPLFSPSLKTVFCWDKVLPQTLKFEQNVLQQNKGTLVFGL